MENMSGRSYVFESQYKIEELEAEQKLIDLYLDWNHFHSMMDTGEVKQHLYHSSCWQNRHQGQQSLTSSFFLLCSLEDLPCIATTTFSCCVGTTFDKQRGTTKQAPKRIGSTFQFIIFDKLSI